MVVVKQAILLVIVKERTNQSPVIDAVKRDTCHVNAAHHHHNPSATDVVNLDISLTTAQRNLKLVCAIDVRKQVILHAIVPKKFKFVKRMVCLKA